MTLSPGLVTARLSPMAMWLSPRTRNALEKQLPLSWGRAWKRRAIKSEDFVFNHGLFVDLTGSNGK